MDIDIVWNRYKKNHDVKTRDYLASNYFFLAEVMAKKTIATLPNTVELDDLISYGCLGLMDAIEKFEPDRGYKFETYASQRIRGAILDGLRSMDPVSRTTRSNNRSLSDAISMLEIELERTPSDIEIAEFMGISLKKLHSVYVNKTVSDVTYISSDNEEYVHEIPDSELTADTYAISVVRDKLCNSIEGLTDKEKIIVVLYYYEDLTFAEIGDIIGVTDSRICQIHTKLIYTLTEILKESL